MRNWPCQIRMLAGLLVAAATFARPSSPQSLRKAADSAGVLIGTAVRAPQLAERDYASTLAREFNLVEAEDAMKWWVVRPTENAFDFRQGDEIVRFANSHGMKIRGHCLLWGRDNPNWLTQGHLPSQRLSQLLHEHISRVINHYAGQVFAWDVVNEALDENGKVRDSLWYNQPGIGSAGKGTAYIEQAFRWAHAADPHALLFYNDAEGEGLNRKSDAIYSMVKDFRRRGVPIDGVGLQFHISKLELDPAAVSANIARLSELGVQVHITELDVSLPVDSEGNPIGKDDLLRQAEIYRGVVHACLMNPGCTAIQTWGFSDQYSWIGSHSRSARGWALPLDLTYKPKPAYEAIAEELASGRGRVRQRVHKPN